MSDVDGPLFVLEEIPVIYSLIRKFHIESIIGQSFEIKNGIRSTDGFRSHLLIFDRSGNRRYQNNFSREGWTTRELLYDERGRLLLETAYEASAAINYRIESIYDHDPSWKEKRMYLADDVFNYRLTAKRDEKGILTEVIYSDPAGQKFRTDSYVYDDRNRLTRVSMGHMGEWLYEYCENNNVMRKTGRLPSASAFGDTVVFQYDNRGLLVQSNHLHYSITAFEYAFFV
jgi:hypothetical protein